MVIAKYDFLNEKDFVTVQRLSTEIFLNRQQYTFDCNYARWGFNIIKESNAVLIYDVVEKEIWDIFLKATNRNIKSIMFYYWVNNSFIPWHDDSIYGGAGTLYLNEHWEKESGGIYLYETPNKEIKAILPKRNLLLEQYEYSHSTTPTAIGADIRQTVQIFYNDSKRDT